MYKNNKVYDFCFADMSTFISKKETKKFSNSLNFAGRSSLETRQCDPPPQKPTNMPPKLIFGVFCETRESRIPFIFKEIAYILHLLSLSELLHNGGWSPWVT